LDRLLGTWNSTEGIEVTINKFFRENKNYKKNLTKLYELIEDQGTRSYICLNIKKNKDQFIRKFSEHKIISPKKNPIKKQRKKIIESTISLELLVEIIQPPWDYQSWGNLVIQYNLLEKRNLSSILMEEGISIMHKFPYEKKAWNTILCEYIIYIILQENFEELCFLLEKSELDWEAYDYIIYRIHSLLNTIDNQCFYFFQRPSKFRVGNWNKPKWNITS